VLEVSRELVKEVVALKRAMEGSPGAASFFFCTTLLLGGLLMYERTKVAWLHRLANLPKGSAWIRV
jgi:hypothetical protein